MVAVYFLVKTDGTYIELGWASALGKPIIIVAENPLPNCYSHLIIGLNTITTINIIDYKIAQRNPSIIDKIINNIFSSPLK